MKRLTVLSIIAFFFFPNIYAQEFLEIGKQWVYENHEWWATPYPTNRSIQTMTVEKDTLINNLVYKQLTITANGSCGLFGNLEFLREEGSKIYRLNKEKTAEYLMIDFAETVTYDTHIEEVVGHIENVTATAIIDSFGIEMIHGKPINVQYMHILNNFSYNDEAPYKVYESIGFWGNTSEFLFPNLGTGLCDTRWFQNLKCVISSQDTINFENVPCFELMTLSSQQVNRETFRVFPNPTIANLKIELGTSIDTDTQIKIMNIDGKEMKAINIEFGLEEVDINVSSLASGMYFIQIQKDKFLTTRKFVKL